MLRRRLRVKFLPLRSEGADAWSHSFKSAAAGASGCSACVARAFEGRATAALSAAERAGRACYERPGRDIREARRVGWIIVLGSGHTGSADASVSKKA